MGYQREVGHNQPLITVAKRSKKLGKTVVKLSDMSQQHLNATQT